MGQLLDYIVPNGKEFNLVMEVKEAVVELVHGIGGPQGGI